MPFFLHIVCLTALYIPLSLGYTFLFGRGKVFHFGPIGVSLVSVYGTFLTFNATGSFVLGLFMGIVMALLFSAIFAWLSFRLDSDGLGILTIAGHLAILNIILNWQGLTNGALGIANIPRLPFMESQEAFAIGISVVCACWIGFFLWLDRTSLARQVSALAENEWHAKSLGINRIGVHLVAFMILGLCQASDNFFYPQYLHLLYPSDYMFPGFIAVIMRVIAGKPGSIWGAILSTAILTFLKEALRFIPMSSDLLGPVRLLLFGAILLAAVWYRRDSLFPKKRTI
jgi:branched-chain amino acid transport system permease protein